MNTKKQEMLIECSNRPEELLVVATGFEERSTTASHMLSEGYKAQCVFIADFVYKTTEYGEAIRKRATRELVEVLANRDVSGKPALIPLRPHDFRSFWRAIASELQRRNIELSHGQASFDISCLPRLQLMFLVRELSQITLDDCRFFYSEPEYYSTEKGGSLVLGQYHTLTLPYESPDRNTEITQTIPNTSNRYRPPRRVCIVGLGHEGDRVLNIWHEQEPHHTVILRAMNRIPRRNAQTDIRNRFFIRQAELGNPAFTLISYPMEDLSTLRRKLETFASSSNTNGAVEYNIIPYGPKPQALAIAGWASENSYDRFNLNYFLPGKYDGMYSSGALRVLEYKLGSRGSFHSSREIQSRCRSS